MGQLDLKFIYRLWFFVKTWTVDLGSAEKTYHVGPLTVTYDETDTGLSVTTDIWWWHHVFDIPHGTTDRVFHVGPATLEVVLDDVPPMPPPPPVEPAPAEPAAPETPAEAPVEAPPADGTPAADPGNF